MKIFGTEWSCEDSNREKPKQSKEESSERIFPFKCHSQLDYRLRNKQSEQLHSRIHDKRQLLRFIAADGWFGLCESKKKVVNKLVFKLVFSCSKFNASIPLHKNHRLTLPKIVHPLVPLCTAPFLSLDWESISLQTKRREVLLHFFTSLPFQRIRQLFSPNRVQQNIL